MIPSIHVSDMAIPNKLAINCGSWSNLTMLTVMVQLS